VEQWLGEMIEQANQVTITHWESLYESLDKEVRAPIRPFM